MLISNFLNICSIPYKERCYYFLQRPDFIFFTLLAILTFSTQCILAMLIGTFKTVLSNNLVAVLLAFNTITSKFPRSKFALSFKVQHFCTSAFQMSFVNSILYVIIFVIHLKVSPFSLHVILRYMDLYQLVFAFHLSHNFDVSIIWIFYIPFIPQPV